MRLKRRNRRLPARRKTPPPRWQLRARGSTARGIDGPTIARLVARAARVLAMATDSTVAAPTPRWLPLLMEQIAKTNLGVQRAIGRVEGLGAADMDMLLNSIGQLVLNLTELTARIQSSAQQTGNLLESDDHSVA
jgi:hypothetical protein